MLSVRINAFVSMVACEFNCNLSGLNSAHTALKAKWDEEEQALIAKRHATVKSMVKGISAKTLLQQTGRSVRVFFFSVKVH